MQRHFSTVFFVRIFCFCFLLLLSNCKLFRFEREYSIDRLEAIRLTERVCRFQSLFQNAHNRNRIVVTSHYKTITIESSSHRRKKGFDRQSYQSAPRRWRAQASNWSPSSAPCRVLCRTTTTTTTTEINALPTNKQKSEHRIRAFLSDHERLREQQQRHRHALIHAQLEPRLSPASANVVTPIRYHYYLEARINYGEIFARIAGRQCYF